MNKHISMAPHLAQKSETAKQSCTNDLPTVTTQKWNGQESNP